MLESDQRRWVTTLVHLLADTEDSLDHIRKRTDEPRFQVLADFENEHRLLLAAYARVHR